MKDFFLKRIAEANLKKNKTLIKLKRYIKDIKVA